MLALAGGLLAAGACRTGSREPARTATVKLPVTSVARVQYSAVEERERRVIRDGGTWTRYWSLLTRDLEPPGPPPTVDFDREMVILAGMGRRATGGYTIAIDSAYVSDEGLVVWVTETSPGAGCVTTQAFTAPAAAARVPRLDGRVRFTETARTRDCQ
ncbi:MAG: protease complex subunit PrcB family protein [Gemmatimonadota bacterium]